MTERRLLDVLGVTESVLHLHALLEPMGIVAVAESRVVFVPSTPPDALPTSIARPIRVAQQSKTLLGIKAYIVGAEGVEMEMTFKRAKDLESFAPRASDAPRPHDPAPHPHPSAGPWAWWKAPESWQEAELLAAEHMRYLGFTDAVATPTGRDRGLDVVAQGAAAQVKLHAAPTGGPQVQALFGAAYSYPMRLFYATAYTDDALAAADQLGVALFKLELFGRVTPFNGSAQTLLIPVAPVPPPVESAWAAVKRQAAEIQPVSIDDRVRRCARWADQITTHVQTAKISNRDRRAGKQLREREAALVAVVEAMERIRDLDNPIYRGRRRKKMLDDVASDLRAAARTVGATLR